ncbi:delta-6 fatty acid desaturase [Umbelopsis sp. PMI_123]|nr:delta-6 fatty acid desaturase [Umbelopsis sp. PMI_123]
MPPNNRAFEPTLYKYITHKDLSERVKQGELLIIFNEKVYKLDRWIKSHPGGELAIRHVVGKDATDEITSMHPAYIYEKTIPSFYVGEYVDNLLMLPNIKTIVQPAPSEPVLSDHHRTNDLITRLYLEHKKAQDDVLAGPQADIQTVRNRYRRLKNDIAARGFFHCNYWRYAMESCRYVGFFYLAIYLVLKGSQTWHYLLSAVFMAAFWHQLTFTAHDAGHNGITGLSKIDHIIGILIAGFCGGLSIGWWKNNHNVHHIVTNDPINDPDIQHMPFFAVTTRIFNAYSTYYKRVMKFDAAANFFVRHQHKLYYVILSFGRFNLHAQSFIFLFTAPRVRFRWLEFTGICCFFVWYSYLLSFLPSASLRFAYVLISYVFTVPLHVQITLSHFGMSTEDLGPNEPFPSKMLRTTMDVDCPVWFDWFHGGLQYQAVHHLFPRIPRHNLRQCVPLVKQFCKDLGLTYHVYTFSKGNGVVLGAMKSVGDQVRLMNQVAQHNAEEMINPNH